MAPLSSAIEAKLAKFHAGQLDPLDPCATGRCMPASAKPLLDRMQDASEAGDLPALRQSLAAYRELVHEHHPDYMGRSLLRAIHHRQRDVIAYLLSENVAVSDREVRSAVEMADRVILKMLFDASWDINQELGPWHPPALAYALHDAELTAWLLAQGADPNADGRDAPIKSPVFRKDPRARQKMVEYLLQKGAPVNAVQYQNDRPVAYLMHEAFGLGTPLHYAAAQGDLDVLRLLVTYGAKLDIKNSCGETALERAEYEGHQAAAQFLRAQQSGVAANL